METLRKKKILFVITKSNWGGAQQYVYTLATRFSDTRTSVAVALGGTGAPDAPVGLLAERLRAAGIKVIPVRAFMRDVSFLREIRAFFELIRIIHTEKPDILHVNSSKAGGLGALAGRLMLVPRVIFTAHGWTYKEEHRPPYERAFIRFALWLTIQFCHRVIVLSDTDFAAAPVLFSRRKLAVARNGIGFSNAPLLPQAEARATLTRYMTHDGDPMGFPFWIFTIAELHRNKGVDVLIRAFGLIAQQHADAALVIVGDGEMRNELTTLVESLGLTRRVFFTGFVPNAHALLGAANLFALASRKEGLPFVILEAGYARLPVVASDIGSVSEVIEDGVSGLLVAPDNAQALADALARMIDHEGFRERMRFALHARVVRDFSEDTMLRETAAAYRS